MTIWKNVKKHKTEGSSLSLNEDRAGRAHENNNLLRKSLLRIQEYQPERIVWTLVRVHLTESLNVIEMASL